MLSTDLGLSMTKSPTPEFEPVPVSTLVPAPLEIKAKSVPSGGLQYDPLQADIAVRARNLVGDKRFWQMARTLASFSVEAFSDRITKGKYTKSELRKRSAMRYRHALVDLGPTFIKLGQFLSVRRDCLSPEIADELANLQDNVPPFAFELVRSTIESELGGAPETVYANFEHQPIASASIGQVHRATLKDGRSVVVKVQRPDLAQLFYQDLGYMRLLARWGVLLRPQGQWDSWIALSDEFGKTLFQEIDYIQEGKNADKIRHLLRNHEGLRVPRVIWKHTGRRALTLEYLPGTKIDKVAELQAKNIDVAKLGNELVNSYLELVMMHGFFHADPHAGNLSVDDDGKIIIYDFGMIGEISEAQREAITGCIAAVVKRDLDELIKNLTALGIIKADAKIGPVKRSLQPFLEYYSGKALRDLDFAALEYDIDQIAVDKALMMPPNLAYVLRAGTSLEGIARTLQPNFSFVEAAKPALRNWVLSRPATAASLIKVIFNGHLNMSDDKLLKLAPGKNLEVEVPPRGQKRNGSKSEASDDKNGSASLQEVKELKAKVYLLETQIKSQKENKRKAFFVSIWLLASAMAFGILCNLPDHRTYANLFLIGNGVMGAIILWHLVVPDSLARRLKNSGQSRGQRR